MGRNLRMKRLPEGTRSVLLAGYAHVLSTARRICSEQPFLARYLTAFAFWESASQAWRCMALDGVACCARDEEHIA